jgi:hypothetical protein
MIVSLGLIQLATSLRNYCTLSSQLLLRIASTKSIEHFPLLNLFLSSSPYFLVLSRPSTLINSAASLLIYLYSSYYFILVDFVHSLSTPPCPYSLLETSTSSHSPNSYCYSRRPSKPTKHTFTDLEYLPSISRRLFRLRFRLEYLYTYYLNLYKTCLYQTFFRPASTTFRYLILRYTR